MENMWLFPIKKYAVFNISSLLDFLCLSYSLGLLGFKKAPYKAFICFACVTHLYNIYAPRHMWLIFKLLTITLFNQDKYSQPHLYIQRNSKLTVHLNLLGCYISWRFPLLIGYLLLWRDIYGF